MTTLFLDCFILRGCNVCFQIMLHNLAFSQCSIGHLFGLVVTVTNSMIYTFSLRSRAVFSFQEISNFYGNRAATAGLKSSSKKINELWINSEITPDINVYNVGIERVELLAYLG